jgi:integrase
MAGRGSIEKRGKDSWRLTVSLGMGEDGKYIKKRKTVKAKNKTEARLLLNEFIMELEAGEYIDPSKMKFSDFLDEWKNKYAIEHLSPNTLDTYESILNAYILPVFANKRLDEIKPIHIINYLESLKNARKDGKEGGLSSSSIQYHHRVLKNIFSRAKEWKLIKSNPVESVKKPKVDQKITDVYTTEEVQQLFKLLEDEPIHQRLIITLAITCGMRRGEILGLQWKDLDFTTNTIHIRHSLYYTKKHGYQLKTPKTKSSIRSIIAPNFVMHELKKYYHEKKKERLKAAELWEGGQYFFVFSTWNGKPLYPTAVGTWWRRFLKRTGFKKIRFHDLRHTAATLLINQGLHPKIISERLGHADIKTTMNIYGHYLKEADQEAANKLDELFKSNAL